MNWCRFGIHKWSKWSPPEEIEGCQRVSWAGVPITDWRNTVWTEQTRKCERCGKCEAITIR